jgi:hypothetical protein
MIQPQNAKLLMTGIKSRNSRKRFRITILADSKVRGEGSYRPPPDSRAQRVTDRASCRLPA